MHKIPVPRTFSADEPFPREHCRHILFTTVKWGDHAHTVALVPFAPSNNSGSPANQLVSSHSNARMSYVYIKRLDLFEAIHIYINLVPSPLLGLPVFMIMVRQWSHGLSFARLSIPSYSIPWSFLERQVCAAFSSREA